MKLVTAQEMRELEKRADAAGNSYAEMMERAGTLTAQAIMARGNVREQRILVLIGPGNNGGDGLVCARVLHDAGASVRLYLWKREPDENEVNRKLCQERGIPFVGAEDDADFSQLREKLAHANVIVDALLGTGVSRPLDGDLKNLLDTVRETLDAPTKQSPLVSPDQPTNRATDHPTVVAVDLPTGLNPDDGALDPATVPADLTVTFAFPKVGHYTFPGADAVGELVVADINIPPEWASDVALHVATADEIRALLPKRARDSNKGTFGKTMIACGSMNYTGAPVLAARAAGRSGTGLVTLALPQTIHPIVAARIDEATFVPLPDRVGDWRPRSANELLAVLWESNYDALLVGCGLGRSDSTAEFLQRLLEQLPTLKNPPPLVLDADALNLLAEIPEWWARFDFATPPILTPHPGEMARLLGTTTAEVQANRINRARDAARAWDAIVALKGAFTVIASPDANAIVIPFANSALATAGTGDVLAGTIAGFAAQLYAAEKRAATQEAEPGEGTIETDGEEQKAARAEETDSSGVNAALVGAYIHALAGELAAQEIGAAGVLAGDLISRLPAAMQRLSKHEPSNA